MPSKRVAIPTEDSDDDAPQVITQSKLRPEDEAALALKDERAKSKIRAQGKRKMKAREERYWAEKNDFSNGNEAIDADVVKDNEKKSKGLLSIEVLEAVQKAKENEKIKQKEQAALRAQIRKRQAEEEERQRSKELVTKRKRKLISDFGNIRVASLNVLREEEEDTELSSKVLEFVRNQGQSSATQRKRVPYLTFKKQKASSKRRRGS